MNRIIYVFGVVSLAYTIFLLVNWVFSDGNAVNILAIVGIISICIFVIMIWIYSRENPDKAKLLTSTILGQELFVAIENFIDDLPEINRQATSRIIASLIYRFTRVFTIGLIAAVIPTVLLFVQNNKIQSQNELISKQTDLLSAQNSLITNQLHLDDANRRAGLVTLFSSVLDEMSRELEANIERKLSDQLIARIKYLSNSLRPYTYFEEGEEVYLSPERGQLFSVIVSSNINEESLDEIMGMTTFEYADLRGYKFHDVSIHRAKLNYSNLDNAMFHQCSFEQSDFVGASLDSCLIQYSTLKYCSFEDNFFQKGILKNDTIINSRFIGIDAKRSHWEHLVFIGTRLINIDLLASKTDWIEFQNASLINVNASENTGVLKDSYGIIVLREDYEEWKSFEDNSLFKQLTNAKSVNIALDKYKLRYGHHLFYTINVEGGAEVKAFDIDLDSLQSPLLMLDNY